MSHWFRVAAEPAATTPVSCHHRQPHKFMGKLKAASHSDSDREGREMTDRLNMVREERTEFGNIFIKTFDFYL